jgi:hypothetical protein
MSIDPQSAVLSLNEVARVEKRTRDAFYYAGSSIYLIMWGALTALINVIAQFWPDRAMAMAGLIKLFGLVAGLAIAYSQKSRRHDDNAIRILWAVVVLSLFGALWEGLLGLGDLALRQRCAIQSSLYMMGFVLAGLWVGRFFLFYGAVATAAIVAGYLWSGAWFNLWLAAVVGGGMLLGGLYVRRIGVAQ